jgi:hypothetical protein
VPPRPRPGIVHEPDPRFPHVDDQTLGQTRAQLGLVDVPTDGGDRAEPSELGENGCRHHVAAVQDHVGFKEQPETLVRQPPRTAREVGVGDDRGGRQRFFFGFRTFGLCLRSILPTRNALLITTVTRAGFISAARRIPYA